MLRPLILIIFFLPVSSAFAQDTCSGKIDLSSQMSLFERVVAAFSSRDGHKANPREVKFIAKHPLVALDARDLIGIATKHSQILCGPKWIDKVRKIRDRNENEVDAIRHFVLATSLGYFYPEHALPILFNHEIDGEHPLGKENFVDLHNNRLGIEFADELKSKSPKSKLSKDEVAFVAVEKALHLLKKGELKALNSIAHGPCSEMDKKSDAEIGELVNKHKERYDVIQRSCIGPAIDCGIQ